MSKVPAQILSPEEQHKRVAMALAMDFIMANLHVHKTLSAESWADLNHKYCNSQVAMEVSNAAFVKAVKQLKRVGYIRDVSTKKPHGIGEVETVKAVKLLPAGVPTAKDRYYYFYRRDYYEAICRSNFLEPNEEAIEESHEEDGIPLDPNPVRPYS